MRGCQADQIAEQALSFGCRGRKIVEVVARSRSIEHPAADIVGTLLTAQFKDDCIPMIMLEVGPTPLRANEALSHEI